MDATKRFSDRVENYIKYRPGYPQALIDHLVTRAGLLPGAVVADIGSGTGIFSELLLARDLHVFAVEPNREMREAADNRLSANARFVSVEGSAENTGLAGRSLDLVTAAQAFHWFDPPRARAEFQRVLRPAGSVALIWNNRKVNATPFLEDYDALLRARGTDYENVNHRNVDAERLRAFFSPGAYHETVFANRQCFDWDGLYGRAMSSSYVPAEGAAGHDAFAAGLREVFDRHADNGSVTFEYDTRLSLGALA